MSAPRNPWSDPATPTEQGAPYAGPPATAPQPAWGAPLPGPPGVASWPGYAGYGPPWPVPPTGPRRPGQLIASAVLAFVQAGVVTLASGYVFLLASLFTIADGQEGFPGDGQSLAAEATVLAAVQVVSVVALVVGGIMVLNRRSRAARGTLLGALGVQLALAAYWGVRLSALLEGAVGPDPSAALLFGVFCFAVAPAVALGLLVSRPVREWFAGERATG
ncbi:hypothetical protein GCU56_11695 [Geodermatophilus sabuli]|uniref:Uncharacterized protein n=1 Tax=Geodermatophilus sabuli TaxID=1564158 RepID=A0A7K3W102_9ACTN|nr:hypothetical protein [Geodermatophilus sabuli]NEK58532.1 hypothetical protein [Geodermatophilus sabuli]